MNRELIKGEVYTDDYGYSWNVVDKTDLIDKIWNLSVGEGFDWVESANNDLYEVNYRVEKIRWSDCDIVLLGGYGGTVMTCDGSKWNDYTDVENLVDDFFKTRNIKDDEFIFIAR